MTTTHQRTGHRFAIVTGAASGIGAATATLLETAGWEVLRIDQQPNSSEAPSTDRTMNVADPTEWAALAEHLQTRGTQVHGLVNAAGITRRARIWDVAAQDFEAAFAVNATGPAIAIRHLTPLMGPGASIVNVGSVAATVAHYAVAYAASKWALRGITHAAAMDLGARGIRVNIVHPGYTETAMTANASPAFRHASLNGTPLGKAGAPEDVANAISFLLSDAARQITGTEINVDGGFISAGGGLAIAQALDSGHRYPPHG
jgi:3alpha(or 20beta)-hydroxysteroid dehydrogenase